VLGRDLLHYHVTDRLGAGGMGVVWKAVDTRLNREVALKVMAAKAIGDPKQRQRFAREARAASSLNHPNIITIYEVGSDGETDFIAMEYVRGRSLFEILRVGPLPAETAVSYAIQVCEALAKAHAAGIVHRDLKPGNLMVTDDGLVKVLDFGLAQVSHTAPDSDAAADEQATITAALTRAGTAIGTLAYMSPEQALGDSVDARSDLFSAGVVLYEMVSGKRPFEASSNVAAIRQLLASTPRPVSEIAPRVPRELLPIISKALAKEPADRYQSALEMQRDLKAIAAPAPGAPVNRRRIAWTAAAVVALLATVLAVPGSRRVLTGWAGGKSAAEAPRTAHDWYAAASQMMVRFDRKGNLEKAIDAYNRALALEPNNAVVYAGLSQAYEGRNQLSPDPQWRKLEMEYAQKAVTLNGDLAAAHIAMAGASADAGQREEAQRQFQRGIELDPLNARAYTRYGKFLASGQSKDTEAVLRKGVELGHDDWWPLMQLGTFYYGEARYKEAAGLYERAKAAAPDNVLVLRALGAVYHMLDRDDEAAAELQRALEVEPSPRLYSNLGTLRYFQGKYLDAVAPMEKAVEGSANNYLYWGNLADAYRWTPGNEAKAKDAYLRAIQLGREKLATNPEDSNLRSSIAGWLAKRGDKAEALSEAARVDASPQKKPGTLFKCALAYEIAGKRDKALASLAAAIEGGYALREIENEPELASLRADVRYHRLIAKAEAGAPKAR
jgi:tetratricopeptide (TPR) repeat protein/predicted Ser/Thr protein kinase